VLGQGESGRSRRAPDRARDPTGRRGGAAIRAPPAPVLRRAADPGDCAAVGHRSGRRSSRVRQGAGGVPEGPRRRRGLRSTGQPRRNRAALSGPFVSSESALTSGRVATAPEAPTFFSDRPAKTRTSANLRGEAYLAALCRASVRSLANRPRDGGLGSTIGRA